jgi:RNA polymerase sigma-70 factor (ECF subfamily)
VEHAHEQGPKDLAELAAQSAWARRLAIALARDVQAGEDVAQEALLASVRRQPSGDLRAWLTRVIRNLARLRLRTEGRRSEREQHAPRPDASDDPALVLQRIELQEALLGAVRALAEPYRNTVLLRWFEELEPEEIARRTQTPVRTVHTRLHRALALLREELDRRSRGDRPRWLAAWLPALTKSSSGWKWLLLMELKTKLAIAGLAVLAGTTVWVVSNPAPRPEAPSALALANEPAHDAATGVSTPLEGAETLVERREAASESGSQVSAHATAAARRRIHGLVIDVTGKKLPHLELVFRSGENGSTDPASTDTSDVAGGFELEADAQHGARIEPVSSDWVVVYKPELRVPDPNEGYVLVLARPRLLHGIVQDSAARPVEGAEVWLSYEIPGPPGEMSLWNTRTRKPSSRRKSPMSLDLFGDPLRDSLGVDLGPTQLQDRGWDTISASTGSFSIHGVDSLPNARVSASAPGYDDGEADPRENEGQVVIVLHKRSDVRSGQLYGKVVGPDGKVVSHARLRFGTHQADSDELGEFVIGVDEQPPGTQLIAFHRDWRPVLQACLSQPPTDKAVWPDPLVLQFTEAQTGIAGVVVDFAGKPVPKVEVLTLDPLSWNQMFGTLGESPIHDGDDTDRVLGDDCVSTDLNGRFSVAALAGRSCRLLVRDRHTLEIAVSDPIPAGTSDARIVFGRDGGRCRFAGRIVDLHGNPIAGGRIAPMRTVAGSGPRAEVRVDSDGVPMDAEGRFEIADNSCGIEAFIVWSDPAAPAKIVPLDAGADRESLLIRVGQIARVQVEIHTPSLKADKLVFLDAAGTQRQVGVKMKGGWAGGDEWSIGEGRTQELIVSEEAKTLVLKLQGEEVARVAIDLDPSRVTLIQP